MPIRAGLVLLVVLGSALSWWPLLMQPGIEPPWWGPFVLIAVITGLATALCPGHWLYHAITSGLGSFLGLSVGSRIWPPLDPIAAPLAPIILSVMGLLAVIVAVIAAVSAREVTITTVRRAAWLTLTVCVASGPVAVALTPSLVNRRIEHNDRAAAGRFQALKTAVEQTFSGGTGRASICDGFALRRHYSGRPFTDEDWRRIAGNYVTAEGYSFMVFCSEKGGYTIHASPSRPAGQGTREFCTDESGAVGCGAAFNGSRYACTACPP